MSNNKTYFTSLVSNIDTSISHYTQVNIIFYTLIGIFILNLIIKKINNKNFIKDDTIQLKVHNENLTKKNVDSEDSDSNDSYDTEDCIQWNVHNILTKKDIDSENDDSDWSDETGGNEAEKLCLNFKLKNKIDRDFYEDQIIKDKYKDLENFERCAYHHRSRYTYGGNKELNLWEKDKNYLIRSWEELKQDFFETQTIKQKQSHFEAFQHTMRYKPINFTGNHKFLNDELRKDDYKHLNKMKEEIEKFDNIES